MHVSLAFETSSRCPCESQGMQVGGSALGTRTGIYLVSMLGLSISISSIKAQKEARQNRKNKDIGQRDKVQTESYTSCLNQTE